MNKVVLLDIRYLRHSSGQKMSLGIYVREYVLKMISLIEMLKDLEVELNTNLQIDLIFNFARFIWRFYFKLLYK